MLRDAGLIDAGGQWSGQDARLWLLGDYVAAVAIRRLSPPQAVLAGAVPGPSGGAEAVGSGGKTWFAAPDGAGLWSLLRDTDVV